MPESQKPDETKGSLTVKYKKDGPIKWIWGIHSRIASLPQNLLLLTPRASFQNVSKETAEFVKTRYSDVPWKGKVEISVNHTPLFGQIKRLFSNERRPSLFARATIGVPTTLGAILAGKFTRRDLYNPFTETVINYHPDKAVGMHEVGHARDFDKSRFPTLKALAYGLPFGHLVREWRASRNAMSRLTKEERIPAQKILEPAFGSYLAGFPGVIGGHVAARLIDRNIFFNKNKSFPKAK